MSKLCEALVPEHSLERIDVDGITGSNSTVAADVPSLAHCRGLCRRGGQETLGLLIFQTLLTKRKLHLMAPPQITHLSQLVQ